MADEDDFVLNIDEGPPQVSKAPASSSKPRPANQHQARSAPPTAGTRPPGQNGTTQHGDKGAQHLKNRAAQHGGRPQHKPQQQGRHQQQGTGQGTPGTGTKRPHDQGAGRGPQQAKGRAPRKGGADGIQERGADSGEEDEVAQLVALVSKRDAALEQELKGLGGRNAGGDGGAQDQQGGEDAVVEFDDSGDEDAAGRKKRRKFAPAAGANAQHDGHPNGHHAGAVRRAGGGKTGKGDRQVVDATLDEKQLPQRVTLAPGQLTHAAPGEAAAELFDTAAAGAAAGKRSVDHAPGSWGSLGLSEKLCTQLESLNFARPTKVQCAAVPPLLQHRDVLVRAATGSGKTLSYLVPIIQDLGHQVPQINRSQGTYALVVAPTRELCLQIQDVAVQILKRFIWLVAGVVIGGENRTHEKTRLRKGVTILVATPGRLADHLHSTASFNTGPLSWLVLDEADRLLDLGFEKRLKEIVELLDQRSVAAAAKSGRARPKRVTALLSATLHSGLAALATMSLNDPVAVGFKLEKGSSGLQLQEVAHSAAAPEGAGDKASKGKKAGPLVLEAGGERYELPSQLRQSFIEVEAKQRLVTLAALLRQKLLGGAKGAGTGVAIGGGKQKSKEEAPPTAKRKAVVFLASCDGVELHHTLLAGSAWRQAAGGPLLGADMPLLKLHGDMPQAQRTAAFVTFSKADCAVLLCTDVAARGLDFPDVTFIVQYDVPGAPSEYVHRVGRTARMGHTGEATLFLMPHERPYVDLLSSRGVTLGHMPAEGPLRWLPTVAGAMDEGFAGVGKGKGKGADKPMVQAFLLQKKLMQAVAGEPKLQALASDAFRSFVRAYATHPADVKHVFHVRNLHLGHVAFAHGLKEVPSMIGASGSAKERKRKRAEEVAAKQKSNKKKLFKQAAAVGASKGNATLE